MMDKRSVAQKVNKLIGEGKTKEAIKWLRTLTLNQKTSNSLALIEGEYNEVRQAETKGVLSFQEIQLKKNQINDKLLSLFEEELPVTENQTSKTNLLKILIPLGIVLLGVFWWMNRAPVYDCPSFPDKINNKIIVLPFEKVAGQEAKPQLILRNRINELAKKNKLSSNAQLGKSIDLTMDKAPALAQNCEADLIVWGTYSDKSDSLRLVMQYYFTNQPDWSSYGDLVTLKDVTALQNGSMLKTMDDAILSLCGIIALREKDNALAQKWFEKVKQKETLDKDVLKIMTN